MQSAVSGRGVQSHRQVAIISPVPAFPPHGGNRARILSLITTLQEAGHDVTFVLLCSRYMGECDDAAHRELLGVRFHRLERNVVSANYYLLARAIKLVLRRLKKGRAGKQKHFDSVDETYFTPFTRQISRVFESAAPDVCIVEYAYYSKAFEAAPAHTLRVLDTHDSFSHEISASEERKALARADIVVAIQENEAAAFRELLPPDDQDVRIVSHIPPNMTAVAANSCKGATFFGSSFAANMISLKYFIDEVLPLILSVEPTFKLFVAGSIANDIKDNAAIIKVGLVQDMSDAFRNAPILVNPIRAGTGVKIKLLDAMALGVPCVSTEFGVQGIPQDFLTGVRTVKDDDAQGFADALLELLSDSEQRLSLGKAAYSAAADWRNLHKAELNRLVTARPVNATGVLSAQA